MPGDTKILRNRGDVKRLKFFPKVGVITQTTQSPENFVSIASDLLTHSNEFKIFNTICPDAVKRQNEGRRLAGKCDIMLVLGGKNSANTKRLAAISKKIENRTYQIETAQEIKAEWFRNAKSVGILAGASTPDWIIYSAVEKIKSIGSCGRGKKSACART